MAVKYDSMAVVVAQLVEQSLTTTEVRGSNPICLIYYADRALLYDLTKLLAFSNNSRISNSIMEIALT